jgi:ParB-like chromosome segregation protein Spo0J
MTSQQSSDQTRHIIYEAVDDVVARFRPQNPKGHDVDAIARSILALGYVTPVLVNETDGLLVEGHGRAEAVQRLQQSGTTPPSGVEVLPDGRWAIPVVRGVHLTTEQARQYTIAANRLAELGGWDNARLFEELEAIITFPGGLELAGFSKADLAMLSAEIGQIATLPIRDPDDVDDLPTTMPYIAARSIASVAMSSFAVTRPIARPWSNSSRIGILGSG